MQRTIQALATRHSSLTTTPLMGGLYVARQETRKRQKSEVRRQESEAKTRHSTGKKSSAFHDVIENKRTYLSRAKTAEI